MGGQANPLDLDDGDLVRNREHFTIFVVYRPMVGPGGWPQHVVFFASGPSGGTIRSRIQFGWADPGESFHAGGRREDNDLFATANGGTVPALQTVVAEVVRFRFADAEVVRHINEIEVTYAAAFHDGGATSDTSSAIVRLGGSAATQDQDDFDLAEIVTYQRDVEQQEIEDFMKHAATYWDAGS